MPLYDFDFTATITVLHRQPQYHTPYSFREQGVYHWVSRDRILTIVIIIIISIFVHIKEDGERLYCLLLLPPPHHTLEALLLPILTHHIPSGTKTREGGNTESNKDRREETARDYRIPGLGKELNDASLCYYLLLVVFIINFL